METVNIGNSQVLQLRGVEKRSNSWGESELKGHLRFFFFLRVKKEILVCSHDDRNDPELLDPIERVRFVVQKIEGRITRGCA